MGQWTAPFQIVLAVAEKTKLVPDKGFTMRDANLFQKMKLDWEARACMWVREGTEADLTKAQAFALREGYMVLTYPMSEKDPLARAKDAALRAARG